MMPEGGQSVPGGERVGQFCASETSGHSGCVEEMGGGGGPGGRRGEEPRGLGGVPAATVAAVTVRMPETGCRASIPIPFSPTGAAPESGSPRLHGGIAAAAPVSPRRVRGGTLAHGSTKCAGANGGGRALPPPLRSPSSPSWVHPPPRTTNRCPPPLLPRPPPLHSAQRWGRRQGQSWRRLSASPPLHPTNRPRRGAATTAQTRPPRAAGRPPRPARPPQRQRVVVRRRAQRVSGGGAAVATSTLPHLHPPPHSGDGRTKDRTCWWGRNDTCAVADMANGRPGLLSACQASKRARWPTRESPALVYIASEAL